MPGKTITIKWISEDEVLKRLGIINKRTLRRMISRHQLYLTYTQINRNSKRMYNEADVENALLEHSNILSPVNSKS